MSDESTEPDSALEAVWREREEVIYPSLFGETRRGIFVLSAELFTRQFRQQSVDPRWLFCGVFEFAPTLSRNSWLYVTSGASNPWELEPADYPSSEWSGLGTELVLEVPSPGDWAIIALLRLLAFHLLLAAGRFGESPPLDYGHRIPLGGSIEGDSLLTNFALAKPEHYPSSFTLASGNVEFLHAIGITTAERDFAKANSTQALIERLQAANAFPVTDPNRSSVMD